MKILILSVKDYIGHFEFVLWSLACMLYFILSGDLHGGYLLFVGGVVFALFVIKLHELIIKKVNLGSGGSIGLDEILSICVAKGWKKKSKSEYKIELIRDGYGLSNGETITIWVGEKELFFNSRCSVGLSKMNFLSFGRNRRNYKEFVSWLNDLH